MSELMQVGSRIGVHAQCPSDRVKDFGGGVSVAALLQALQVLAADTGQQGQFVYAVKPDNTVEIRMVTTGRSFANKMVVEKGIAPGDTVVTDGFLRLFPGAPVRAVDSGGAGAGQS